MKQSFILLSIGLLLFPGCQSDKVLIPDTIKSPSELSEALFNIYSNTEVTGFTVSIVKSDEILYQESFGMADTEHNLPYSIQSTQPIGSISKTFVAASLVKAIEQGYFTLETDINTILPFELINPNHPGDTIRIKHLVTHTSGLLDNLESYFHAYYLLPNQNLNTPGAAIMMNDFGFIQRPGVSLDNLIYNYYSSNGTNYNTSNFSAFPVGSNWNYSNFATSLTAYIIETATQTPFKEYVATQVFQPLGMNDTAYDIADLSLVDRATLYWEKGVAFPNYANDSYPDGSVNTCNTDLTKYLMDLMKGIRGESTTLFSTQGYQMLFDPQLGTGIVPSQIGDNQGVFWFLKDDQIKHDGSDPGTTCHLQFDQSGETGFLLLTNMDASTDEHEEEWNKLFSNVITAIAKFLQSN